MGKEFEQGFDDAFTAGDRQTRRASQGPYSWNNSGIGRYKSTSKAQTDALPETLRHVDEAHKQGFINEAEHDWIVSTSDDSDKRSVVEKLLGYKKHTGGVLGTLDDLFGVIETATGYRAILSVSAAVTEGLKEKGTWGFAFSTEEFKRAWSGELSPHGRTFYKDVLMKGGDELMGVGVDHGASSFAASIVFDIALDPVTYLTFGVSAGTKVSIRAGGTAEAMLKSASGSAKEIPTNLTLTRWGEKVYQRGADELIKTQPENIQRVISKLDGAVDDGFARGGLDIMSPADLQRASTNPGFRRAVTEYTVANYDRLALRASQFDDDLSQLAGQGLSAARDNVRRGPPAMFGEWTGKTTGGYRRMFQETAPLLHKEVGFLAASRVSAGAQAVGALALGDVGMLGSAGGTLLLTEVPALAIKGLSRGLPTSAIRASEKWFRSATERLPVEDANAIQGFKNGMNIAYEGKKAELIEFADAPHYKELAPVVDDAVAAVPHIPKGWQVVDGQLHQPVGMGKITKSELAAEIERTASAGAEHGRRVARHIADNVDDPVIRSVLGRIAPFLENVTIKVVNEGDSAPRMLAGGSAAGVAVANFSKKSEPITIWLRGADMGSSGLSARTVAHELVHAATIHRMRLARLADNADTDLRTAWAGINSLVSVVGKHRKALQKEGKEWAGPNALDPDELVAWGLTDKPFQDMLKTIKVADGTTMWSAFVDKIAAFLGIAPKERSALTELLERTDDLLSANVKNLPDKRLTTKGDEMFETVKQGGEAVPFKLPAARALTKDDRITIAKHLDDPTGDNIIQPTSPLHQAMLWFKDQFAQIAQQERDAGILGDTWEHYVTHYYGDVQSGAVAQWYAKSNKTRQLVHSMEKSTIRNRNDFAMHRIIATFEDAERVTGKAAAEVLDVDALSILQRRWSTSYRMQAQAKATQYMIRKHGIDAIGEGFVNSHAALSQIAGRLGNLSRNYVDLGPAQKATYGELERVAIEMAESRMVKNVDWFKKAPKGAALDGMPAEVIAHNISMLDRIAKRAFGKDTSKITGGELEALRDYLHLAVIKSPRAAKTFETVGKMNGTHRLTLLEVSGTAAGARPGALSHKLERELEFSSAELIRMGKKLAKREDAAQVKAAKAAADEYDAKSAAWGAPLVKKYKADGYEAFRWTDENGVNEGVGFMNSKGGIKSGKDGGVLIIPVEKLSKAAIKGIDELDAFAKKHEALFEIFENGPKPRSDADLRAMSLRQLEKRSDIGVAAPLGAAKAVPEQAGLQVGKGKVPSTPGTSPEGLARQAEIRGAAGATIKQAPTNLRTTIEQGLLRTSKASLRNAVASGKALRRQRGRLKRTTANLIKESKAIVRRLDDAKKEIGDLTSAHYKSTGTDRLMVSKLKDDITNLRAQQSLLESNFKLMTAKGPKLAAGLTKQLAALERKIQAKIKDHGKAVKAIEKLDAPFEAKIAFRKLGLASMQRRSIDLSAHLKGKDKEFKQYAKEQQLTENFHKRREIADRSQELVETQRVLGQTQDSVVNGKFYVPEVFQQAIHEAFGHTWNPSRQVDSFLSQWQRFQLLWKIPLTLPFFEHHGRNAITNAWLTVGHVGLRTLNPQNWIDTMKVNAFLASRSKSQLARAQNRGSLKSGIDEPDLQAMFGQHKIKTPRGSYTVEEVSRLATLHGVTHGFTHAEIDGVAGVFGDLMRGRMIPNLGSMRTAANGFVGRFSRGAAETRAAEGAVGGTAVTAVKTGAAAAAGVNKAALTGGRWLSRKSELAVDVPFRITIFTDGLKRGLTPTQAAEGVRRHLNDWSRLSSFEKKYMRSAIPFYSWTQFSMERFIRDIVSNPKAIQGPGRFAMSVQGAMESEPPNATYASDWMAQRVGIWHEEGENLYSRYLINGINADEAMRQVVSLGELTKAMGHKIAKMSGKDHLAWTVFKPDSNPKDDLRFLSQMDFMVGAVVEGLKGRDLFSGAPTGTVQEVLDEEGYSRYESARHLVHPSTREKAGARWLRGVLDVTEDIGGDPKKARAVAWRRWLLGKTPASRFVSTYERHAKKIVLHMDSGDSRELGRVVFDGAIEVLGTRAYAYDPTRQKLYYQRDRIKAAQNLLLNAGYYEKFGRVWVPKGERARVRDHE